MTLPIGRAVTVGRQLALKINTRNILAGWRSICTARWTTATDGNLSCTLDPSESSGITRFDASFVDNRDGSCRVTFNLVGRLGDSNVNFSLPSTDFTYFNYWAGSHSDTEWDSGNNNNGVGMRLEAPFEVPGATRRVSAQLWPKREDRIRFELNPEGLVMIPGLSPPFEIEFDTRE